MNSIQIHRSLKDEKVYQGVYPRDMIPPPKAYPCAYIANTDTSKEKGEHWVALHISENGRGEYFDPFGLPPLHDEFVKFLNKYALNGWTYNNCQVQNLNSRMCGLYCILYIKTKTNKIPLTKFVTLFTKQTIENDELLLNYVSSYNL